MVRSVLFLGNPGNRYARTRHNIGWMAADVLSERLLLTWQEKFRGSFTRIDVAGEPRAFLRPGTFMNLSGESAELLLRFYRHEPEEMLVVHDEVELAFGTVDLKQGGGLGGHNGLRSVALRLGTRDFLRLRLGVSRPERGDVSGYVLSAFSDEEAAVLPDFLKNAADALMLCLKEGFETAAAEYTKKRVVSIWPREYGPPGGNKR